MSPYDFWKTTDSDDERRIEAGEWIDNRAAALMDERDFLERTTEDHILNSAYDANARPVVELIADLVTLHATPPDRLPGCDVLTRLYAHAKHFYQQIRAAAIEQAEREHDTHPQAA